MYLKKNKIKQNNTTKQMKEQPSAKRQVLRKKGRMSSTGRTEVALACRVPGSVSVLHQDLITSEHEVTARGVPARDAVVADVGKRFQHSQQHLLVPGQAGSTITPLL